MSNQFEDLFGWLVDLLMDAFGTGTPEEGMRASAMLFVVTFASNFIGLWFTIVLDILFAFLFGVHLIRYAWGSR